MMKNYSLWKKIFLKKLDEKKLEKKKLENELKCCHSKSPVND